MERFCQTRVLWLSVNVVGFCVNLISAGNLFSSWILWRENASALWHAGPQAIVTEITDMNHVKQTRHSRSHCWPSWRCCWLSLCLPVWPRAHSNLQQSSAGAGGWCMPSPQLLLGRKERSLQGFSFSSGWTWFASGACSFWINDDSDSLDFLTSRGV